MNKCVRFFSLLIVVFCSACHRYNNITPLTAMPSHSIRMTKNKNHHWSMTPPRCPEIRDQFGNLSLEQNLGCSTAHNLAMMLTDPRDLLHHNRDYQTPATVAARQYRQYQSPVNQDSKARIRQRLGVSENMTRAIQPLVNGVQSYVGAQ